MFDKTIDVERRSFIEKALKNEEDLYGEPRIVISTIHQVKGGEAKNVAVYLDLSKSEANFYVTTRWATQTVLRCGYAHDR